MKSERQYFEHILEELDFIESQTRSLNRGAFLEDQVLKRAVVRSIEIIGEAIKKISTEVKNKYVNVEWRKIAGARDHLIHGYFMIDYDIVWDIMINRVPELRKQIVEILENDPILF